MCLRGVIRLRGEIRLRLMCLRVFRPDRNVENVFSSAGGKVRAPVRTQCKISFFFNK